jgi:putative lysine transport system substrate-binding protein
MKKKFWLIVMAALTVVVLAACGGEKENTVATKGTLTVGLEAAYPPFNWSQTTDANGAVKLDGSNEYVAGYDVEIAKKVADELGLELKIKKIEWDGLPPALETNVIDAIIAGMSPTAERKKTFDFTANYYTSKFVIVTKADGKYANATSLADFDGAHITAQLNTTNYDVIEQIPNVKQHAGMDSFPAMRVAVETGVVDGYIAELPEAQSAAAANKNLVFVDVATEFETAEEDVAVAIGVRKQFDLTDKISEIIKGISEEERANLMEQAIQNQPSQQ